jgi:hypothetical protein
MKKMSRFAMTALLVLGLAGAAQAADIKATGSMQIDASSRSDMDLNKATKENNFTVEERIRTAFQFIANENLKGVLDLQIGTNAWGNGEYQIGSGRTAGTAAGSNSANSGSLMLRKAYIDFKWPDTKVNILAGFQTVNLPAAFGGGSAILDDQVGALVVAAPITDNIKILAGYARPYDSNTSGSTGTVNTGGTGSNVVFAAVPLDYFNSNLTPFAAYANAGNSVGGANVGVTSQQGFNNPRSYTNGSGSAGAGYGLNGYWGGAAFSTKLLDPFKIMADFNYGQINYTENYGANAADNRSGWLFDVAVDYTGLSMMTPEAFFVYSSGDDANARNSGRMPVVGNPQSWTVGSMFFGDSDLISKASTNSGTGSYTGSTRNVMGFWTAGVSLKDIKLIDKLTHRVNLLYIKGTNDKDALVNNSNAIGNSSSTKYANYGQYLTTRDSLWEIDLNSKYKIYDELTVGLNLGYASTNLHRYNGDTSGKFSSDDSVYRATVFMNYTF